MWQIGAAAVLVAGGVAAHTAWVTDKRARGPKGRQLQFVPGSADEALAAQLATGDVIRFSRDCSLYPLLDGVTCLARKASSRYDHWGVIVHVAGVPHVWERVPAGGHALRPYDARLQASLATSVHILPLHTLLAPTDAAAVTAEAKRRVAADPAVTAGERWAPSAVVRHAVWTEAPAAVSARVGMLVRTETSPRGRVDDAFSQRNLSLAAVRDLLRRGPAQPITPSTRDLLAPVRSSVATIPRAAPAPQPDGRAGPVAAPHLSSPVLVRDTSARA